MIIIFSFLSHFLKDQISFGKVVTLNFLTHKHYNTQKINYHSEYEILKPPIMN